MRLALLPSLLPALILLAGSVGSSGCAFVQTRTTAVLIVAREDGPVEFHHYEAVDTHLMTTTAVVCMLTAIFYGGGCWAYVAVPFDDQELQARTLARTDIARDVPCGRLLDWEIQVLGWLPERRRFEIQNSPGGRALTAEEVAALCRAKPRDTAPTTTTTTTTTTTPTTTTTTTPAPPPTPPPEPLPSLDPAG